MLKYNPKRLNNAIVWFAKKHFEKTGKYPTLTQILKYLAFLEFESVKEWGIPAFGLKFKAYKHGPVPEEIYFKLKNLESTDPELYKLKKHDDHIVIIPVKEADEDRFSV
ncbi:type II toxin-antitoxin system antitoxin SocA domain-containing protein [Thermodesulfovibrio sp. 3907-1M]|uniref:Type II toxin-antitoxin system antitoxin SocA domain-containing protein n=1 Tax=Thermodesulfovibrio autotrophicus TaxID=3118333 RepID=A0AAU8H0C9_9BACT